MKYKILIAVTLLLLAINGYGQLPVMDEDYIKYSLNKPQKELVLQQLQTKEWNMYFWFNHKPDTFNTKYKFSPYVLYLSFDIAIVCKDTFYNPVYEISACERNEDMLRYHKSNWDDYPWNSGRPNSWYEVNIYSKDGKDKTWLKVAKIHYLNGQVYVPKDSFSYYCFNSTDMHEPLNIGDRFKVDYGEVFYTITDIDGDRIIWDCKGKPYWMKIVNRNAIYEWLADKRLVKVN